MNNLDVIRNWNNGKSGKNGKHNLTTDGVSLWSYMMLIGITTEEGEKCMLDLSGRKEATNTTKRHVRACYDYKRGQYLARFIQPIYNPSGYIYNTWLFPADVLARALGRKKALDYTDAIITMW